MNLCMFTGKLTGEPAQTRTVNGKLKVDFSIAVPNMYRKEGQPQADFFDCEAWGKHAENIFKFFHKGDGIVLKGRMENNNYTNRDGQKIYRVVLKVEEWDFGPKKFGSDGSNSRNDYHSSGSSYGSNDVPPPYPTDEQGFVHVPDDIDEELPFN